MLEANPAAAATYGYTTEELLGLTDLDLSAEPELTRSTAQSAEVGENVAVPARMHRRKDGTAFAVEMTGRVFSLQGRMVRVVAVRDVTARKRAEEALGRFELLAANSRDIILFMDRDGQIIEANAAAERAYGYTRDELLKLTIADLRAAQTEAEMAAQMTEADERGILFESLHRRRDGGTFAVEVSSRGATVGGHRTLVSVVRDITERKLSEEAVRLSEERFRTLFEHMSQAASLNELVYDSDGVPCDVRFLEVNPAFERQTGLKAHDAVGRTSHDLYNVDEPLWLERYDEVVRTGSFRTLRGTLRATRPLARGLGLPHRSRPLCRPVRGHHRAQAGPAGSRGGLSSRRGSERDRRPGALVPARRGDHPGRLA